MSIGTKITTLFIIVALVPFAMVALLIFSDVRALAERSALSTVDMLAGIQKQRTLELLSKYTLQIDQFTSRLQLRESFSSYTTYRNQADLDAVSRMIVEARRGVDSIHRIDILSTDGIVRASTDADRIGENERGAPFFKKGLVAHSVSDFLKERGVVYVRLSGPLILSGRTIGVASLVVGTEDLFALFRDYTGLGETGSWGLAQKEANGDALFIVPGRFDRSPDSPLQARVQNIPENQDLPIMHAINGVESTYKDLVNYQGKHVLAATRSIPELGWGIGVTQDRAEALAASSALAQQLVFFCALIAAFIVFLSAIITQIIVRPVKHLLFAASKVTAGDLSVGVESASRDEIGALSRTFTKMVHELRVSREDLETKVRNRTQELQEKLVEVERLNKLMVGRELMMADLKKQLKSRKQS